MAMARTKNIGTRPPSHFNCFMWSSVASARVAMEVSPAPGLLRSRALLRLSPRCAFGPPLPPAGDQQPEEFLDAAAYVRLGASNTCSSFLLLDSDYSDCFRFSLSLWFWIECMDNVCSCVFLVCSSWFPLLGMSEHDPNVSSALLEVILGATEGHELIAAHDSSFIVVGVLWCFYMYGNMTICMIHSCFHSSIFFICMCFTILDILVWCGTK